MNEFIELEMTKKYWNYRVSSDVAESQTGEITGGIQKC